MDTSLIRESYTSSALATAIFEHASRISRAESVGNLIRLNSDFARDLTGADRCSLWLIDDANHELWTILADGLESIRIPVEEGLVGACVREQRILLVNDLASDPRFLRSVDEQSGYRTTQILCIPLRSDNEIIGVLQLLNKQGGFTLMDADLVGLLAHFAATAIQGERLRQGAEAVRLLRRELDLASEVQVRMLPQEIPAMPGLAVSAVCRPAQSVGGDYYDLLFLDESRFGFTLGDVSGKGVPAAVMMASIQMLLRSLMLRSQDELATIVGSVSRALYQSSTANRYSTLFCGVLDLETGELTYVNAGHSSPLLMLKDGSIRELAGGDLPLGLLSSCAYEQHTIHLDWGESLLVFSDGIQEVANKAGEFWNDARISEIFQEHASSPVAAFPKLLLDEADAWSDGAEQHDDMTIVLLRRKADEVALRDVGNII